MVFNAKNSFSRAKTARKLAVDHACRTGCCVACKKLNDSMKTEVVALKTSYNGVKSGNVIAQSDKNGCDNIKGPPQTRILSPRGDIFRIFSADQCGLVKIA